MLRKITVFLLLALLTAVLPLVSLAEGNGSLVRGQALDSTEVTFEDHEEYVRSELERYAASEVYFEKYGISINLREYITENNLNNASATLSELIRLNEEHIASLIADEENYDLLLKENAAFFIEKCNELLTLCDYVSIKKICDETRFHFFNMDVSVEGVDEAVITYEASLDLLKEMEDKASVFVNKVYKLVYWSDEGDKLSLILDAYTCFDGVDISVAGVSDAYNVLKLAMEEYDESVAELNSEIALTREAVGYIRNYVGFESFVTIILDAIK